MKNKKLTYTLLAAVVIIWGVLIYKVYNSLKKPDDRPLSGRHKRKHVRPKEEDYAIHQYSRDPFLSIVTDTITEAPPVKVKMTRAPVVKRPLILPQYCGLIQNKKQKIAILKYNKKIFFVHEGEKYESIRIQSIKSDQVLGTSNGDKVVIPLTRINSVHK